MGALTRGLKSPPPVPRGLGRRKSEHLSYIQRGQGATQGSGAPTAGTSGARGIHFRESLFPA